MLRFLADNWLWIVLIGSFLLLHRNGGCAGHGAHGGPADANPDREPVPPRRVHRR